MERIASRQNAIVKRFRELARASAAGSGEVLLDGPHLVQEALACGIPIDTAAFSDRQLAGVLSPLARIAKDVKHHGGRVLAVTDQVLAAMSPVQQPSGVVAIARARPSELRDAFSAPHLSAKRVPSGSDPKSAHFRHISGSDLKAADRAALVMILAGLQDPGNVGTIIRTAAAFGATGVVTIEGSAHPFGWKALRGAMGGTFRLPVAARGSLLDVIAMARDARVRLIAAVPRGGTPLPQLDLRAPAAILLGGEGAGVADTAIAAADAQVTIPMQESVESLNVAIAASLILYEAARQRGAAARGPA